MIKKSEKGFQELANKITKDLEYNKENTSVEARINLTCFEISKGLWGIGSIGIKNKVCEVLGIKPWDAPFSCKINVHFDDYQLLVKYKFEED